jgi:hypothetical protein
VTEELNEEVKRRMISINGLSKAIRTFVDVAGTANRKRQLRESLKPLRNAVQQLTRELDKLQEEVM